MDRIVRADELARSPGPAPGDGPGLRVEWLRGPGSAEGMDVGYLKAAPGGATPSHTHIGGQVMHVVSGAGWVETDGDRQVLRPGDVVVTPPGHTHTHGAADDSPLEMLTVTAGGYALGPGQG